MQKTIWIGSDHAGVELKLSINEAIRKEYVIEDVGPFDATSVDYPDYAKKVGEAVAKDPNALGILICGSGIGMSIAANKISGIRAALVTSVETAKLSRQHNNANVLCLGARTTEPNLAMDIVKAWLNTKFEGDRHQRRIDKISGLETKE